jgi:hypothetical protein
MWLSFVVLVLVVLVLLLIVRLSEMSTRMSIFEQFIAKAATLSDVQDYMHRTAYRDHESFNSGYGRDVKESGKKDIAHTSEPREYQQVVEITG